MSQLRRFAPALVIALAIAALYLYRLDGVGMLGPDEPRYAAIGISMAHNGDLVTPELWGSPWFEKPPLLYWMTAAFTSLGASADVAGRLPVALLSLFFLVCFFLLLQREFGFVSAAVSAACLGTSAGWLAYSDLCLTDVPLAVFFCLAALLCLPLLRPHEGTGHAVRLASIGVCLGLAALAKGLVPFALMLPWFWFLRRYWKRWWIVAGACLAVALPWYAAVTAANGWAFVQEFFVRHHFERLYSPSLQHVQRWYYYVPVLLAGLFPWTPALVLIPKQEWDERRGFLATTAGFGLLFFSSSLNKLPGYLMPLLPCVFALIGAAFERKLVSRTSRALLVSIALLIALIPLLAPVLPASLAAGRLTLQAAGLNRVVAFYVLLPVLVVFLARRAWVGPTLVLSVVAGALYVKAATLPVLDERVSARGLWRQVRNTDESSLLCDGGANRDWIYGLSFYRGSLLLPCGGQEGEHVAVRSTGHVIPTLTWEEGNAPGQSKIP